MWIKICGITSMEDAELAIATGADALGFVFAESPRRLTPEAAREIAEKLPQPVEKIGVFVDSTLDEVAAVSRTTGLTGAQLHHSNPAEVVEIERAYSGDFSPNFRFLRVVRYAGDSARFANELRKLRQDRAARLPTVLIDTCVSGKQGGTGQPFDWTAARNSFIEEAPHLRLIAAGGLCPENVVEAIRTLRPWGVDVSSGVEASPGKKDPARVAAFIQNARAAAEEIW